jgi:hypothetical protein
MKPKKIIKYSKELTCCHPLAIAALAYKSTVWQNKKNNLTFTELLLSTRHHSEHSLLCLLIPMIAMS